MKIWAEKTIFLRADLKILLDLMVTNVNRYVYRGKQKYWANFLSKNLFLKGDWSWDDGNCPCNPHTHWNRSVEKDEWKDGGKSTASASEKWFNESLWWQCQSVCWQLCFFKVLSAADFRLVSSHVIGWAIPVWVVMSSVTFLQKPCFLGLFLWQCVQFGAPKQRRGSRSKY